MRQVLVFFSALVAVIGGVVFAENARTRGEAVPVAAPVRESLAHPGGEPYYVIAHNESSVLALSDMHRHGRYVSGVLWINGASRGPIGSSCEGFKVDLEAKLCELGLGLKNEDR